MATAAFAPLLDIPTGYRDFREPYQIPTTCLLSGIPPAGKCLVRATIKSKGVYDRQGNPANWKPFRISMNANVLADIGAPAILQITVFGNTFPWIDVKPGNDVYLYGEFKIWRSSLQMNNPEIVPSDAIGSIIPIYRGRQGKGIKEALAFADEAAEHIAATVGLPADVVASRVGAKSIPALLRDLHAPMDMESAHRALSAVRRIAALQIMVQAERLHPLEAPLADLPVSQQDIDEIVSGLPYSLTEDQSRAIREIVDDLSSAYPMRRLLSGDVGTGKTLSFLVPAYAAWMVGASVAIVAPNQLLVEQIASEARGFFPDCEIAVVTAGSPAEKLYTPLLVGTTALLNAMRKAGYSPDFLIIDEQHKLSRAQRESLCAPHTNVLEATATAIPRTAALVTHGGMKVSVLRQSPVEKEIHTRVVMKEERRELFDRMKSIITEGGQVAVVYPLVEDDPENDRKSVISAAELWQKHLPGRVGIIHGRMSGEDKHHRMRKMRDGEFDLLVASTVIEIGVTVPNLRAIVVVHAERYGLSQLHQMRGRVARAGGDGWCFLYLSEDIQPGSMERMKALETCSDGFTLAEKDMEMRGFGDFGGGEQSGKAKTLFKGISLMPSDMAAILPAIAA